jgi:hypothetical protein
MPPEDTIPNRQLIRVALQKARKVSARLQGTMGLEGQGLDRATLREMTKRSAREWLSANR